MSLTGLVLEAGAAAVVVARSAAAASELRLRVPGRPAWRRGWAAAVVTAHDVLAGLALFGAAAGATAGAASRTPASPGLVAVLTAVAGGLAFAATPEVLHRGRGAGVRSWWRPRRTLAEPCPTLRDRLLDLAERDGHRASSRWIAARLERCRRDCGVGHEQLLPAVWPAVRLRLRDEPGVPRTEVALLLVQAQTVADDASPAQERLLTLLHLLHDRAGRRAVTAALEQARRTPVRHGRSGPAPWASPAAVPIPALDLTPAATDPEPRSEAPSEV